VAEIWRSLVAVQPSATGHPLICIITGFWLVRPALRDHAQVRAAHGSRRGRSLSWYANVNPAVVVLTVAWVTQLMRRYSA
jgi:hypothetical protein